MKTQLLKDHEQFQTSSGLMKNCSVLVIQVLQLTLQDIKDSCQLRFKLTKVERYLMVNELHWNIP